MACTIVSTPALGASNWSAFITQVTGLKRGFLNVSLTNFASTAVSAIATGGVIEVAGSFYLFTETAIDYSTTTSANADLYIYAQPAAGGTTCSIVALTAAPAWRDDYQGFYASVASLNRAIGGMYVGTAATYFNKYLYGPEETAYCRGNNRTRPILRSYIQIGEWNMDATAYVDLPLPMRLGSKIRQATGIIWDDGPTAGYPIEYNVAGSAGGCAMGLYFSLGQTRLFRVTGGEFDGVNFNATASTMPNRGYVYIEYEA